MFSVIKFMAIIITVGCVSFYALPAHADKAQKKWDQGCTD
jgi:hypothetical protein